MITEYDDNYIAREVAIAALTVAPRLTNDAETYLSTLMVDLMTNWIPEDFDKPLALWLAELQSAPMYERATGLRKLGDTALLKIGLFRSAFATTGLSPSYYVSIGSSAYRSSANIYKALQVYAGLSVYLNAIATQLIEAADVLSFLSRKFFPDAKPMDLLDHYVFYVDVSSEDARQVLLQNGILPVPVEFGTNRC